MLFIIPGVRQVYRNIRTAIFRRRNSPLESTSSQSSSSTSIELKQTSFTAEIIQHPQGHELASCRPAKLQQFDGERLRCQAVEQGKNAAEYPLMCLLFVNIPPPALLENMAAQFTLEQDDPSFFWLKNNCIQGYIGLADDEKIFAIVSNKQSKGCKFEIKGQKIKVQGKELYMKVHETDGMLITTTLSDDGTSFFKP